MFTNVYKESALRRQLYLLESIETIIGKLQTCQLDLSLACMYAIRIRQLVLNQDIIRPMPIGINEILGLSSVSNTIRALGRLW